MSKKLPDELKEAIVASTREFAEMMTTPMSTRRERYLRELVAVTRAAAIGGDYAPAIKGYEVLGKALGHIVERQEVLTHTTHHLAEAPDSELVEILKRAQAKLVLPTPPEPAQPAIEQMTEAEAEALLYAQPA
jgi:hypothetical protein